MLTLTASWDEREMSRHPGSTNVYPGTRGSASKGHRAKPDSHMDRGTFRQQEYDNVHTGGKNSGDSGGNMPLDAKGEHNPQTATEVTWANIPCDQMLHPSQVVLQPAFGWTEGGLSGRQDSRLIRLQIGLILAGNFLGEMQPQAPHEDSNLQLGGGTPLEWESAIGTYLSLRYLTCC